MGSYRKTGDGLFALRMLARYKLSYLSSDSSQSALGEVEVSRDVALLSEWGCALTSGWKDEILYHLYSQAMHILALLNTGRA